MKVTINLLPPNKKELIRIQQLTGRILKVGFSAFSSIVVFILFLISCLFVIDIKENALEKESDQLKKIKIYGEVQKTYDVVNEYYKSVQQLDKDLLNQISYAKLFEELNELIPTDLFLQEVTIAEQKMIIKGFSSNRDSLISFRDRLEKSEFFGSVEAPISNFTASENVNFTFTIDINK